MGCPASWRQNGDDRRRRGAHPRAAGQTRLIVEPNREQLTRISRMIDAGKLRAFVGAAFPLQKASQAYTHKPVREKTSSSSTADVKGTGRINLR